MTDINHIHKLRITEIFYSLQGEALTSGCPTVFVRLTGCPLRCQYCDTDYAFSGGEWMTFEAIKAQISKYKTRYITVTGGEPLAQPSCIALLSELCEQGYQVSLETSGAIDIQQVDARVIKVMDLKTPASGEESKNLWTNLKYITSKDQIKFVICDHEDYLWSKQCVSKYQLDDQCEVLFSPSNEQLPADQLAQWILDDQLNVRFQIQLHKVLWGNQVGK
jgi:7-carboxy-7-deazaguanine synthase